MARPSSDRRGAPDLRAERLTLFELLDTFPGHLRLVDLTDRLTRFEDAPTFGHRDKVGESVAELVGFGLVFRQGDLVLPTMAAVHFDLILEGF